ncbi:MAG: AIR synthase family protein [Promethearchaeota archaeon]
MRTNHLEFHVGKLRYKYLKNMLKQYVSNLEKEDKRLILGSKIGEDAAVIDMGDNCLVAKTDPITFATDEIGYYAVNVNVNDVVCMGATPKWFQSTILLPEKRTSEDLIEKIFKGIHDTCKSMNITVVGGHTEITHHLNRPIVIGSLLGEVEKDKLVKTSGAKSGDALILTKGIFIEGTSIIAREKENFLKEKGYDFQFINRCKKYLHNPGISVFKEALLANKNFQINSMHDPTEGGLNTGIAEMGIASNLGVVIKKDKIKILPEPLELSKVFNINPLGTISSGSLLISIAKKNSLELIELMKKNDIDAEIIGEFSNKEKEFFIVESNGQKNYLTYSEIDEITKIF